MRSKRPNDDGEHVGDGGTVTADVTASMPTGDGPTGPSTYPSPLTPHTSQRHRSPAGDRVVAIWLLACCALVFAMVVLGGVTRLTGSGLSMVDWRPVTGVLPPLSAEEWQQTFERYQQSPEYRHVNRHMDVEDFKGIFWLEYLHRLLGRMIGVVFALPFLFFLWQGYIPRRDTGRYVLMFALGGLQGLLGWYMVKSGLVDNPHVSQYRLTAHLGAAILIYAYMFWVALSLLADGGHERRHPRFGITVALTTLILVTLMSGGLVAGLKAGLVYNTFPKMGEGLIPPGLFALEPWWLNFFENNVTAQFDHRLLAITTLVAVLVYWAVSLRRPLPRRTRPAVHLLAALVVVQAALGISTLLLRVPVPLASAHQTVAVLLFTVALYLCHAFSRARGDQTGGPAAPRP